MSVKNCLIFTLFISLIFPILSLLTGLSQEGSQSEKNKKEPLSEWSKQWLEEVVPYIITDVEKEFFIDLSTEVDRGKFIESFWKKRDPNPRTPENEFKLEYYKRIALANKFFGASGIEGWRTERGKIYILLGPPNEIQRDMSPSQTSFSTFHGPKETWNYWGLPNPKLPYNMEFVFVDKLGTGDYVLEKSLKLSEMGSSTFNLDSMHYYFNEMEYLAEAMRNPFEDLDKLRGIITTQVTYDRIPIHYDLFYLKGQEQRTYIPLVIKIPYSALTHKEIEGEFNFSLTLLVEASNKLGQIIFERTKDFKFKHTFDELDSLKDMPFKIQSSLFLEPEAYKIHLLILDNFSGKVGTVHQEFLVPNFNTGELSLSDIILWSEEKAQTKAIDLTKEKISADIKQTFYSDEELNVFFEVYNLALDPETGASNFTAEYLFFQEEKLLTRVSSPRKEPTSDNDCRVQSSLRLKNFKPGEYTLRVKVVDSISGKEISKDISFNVI